MDKSACRISVIVLASILSSSVARAETAATSSDIAALRKELRALATRDQQQIEALQNQVRALSAALAARRGERVATAPSSGAPVFREVPRPMEVPPPVLRGPVLPPVMMNLPGRSAVAPYTSTGPGQPGQSPVTPAAPVTSGGSQVTLSLSGQVNRALLWGNDGLAAKLHQVDNNNSSTRIRIVGEAQPMADTVAGMNLETEIRPNSSASQTLTQNLPQPASAVTFTIRQAEVYAANPNYGGVRLGFGSTASYLTAEVDLSGTAVASYVQVPDFDGGFAFRQRAGAAVPGGAHGAFVFSPAGSYGPAVGSVFNFFDGLGRDDRIRYDTPVWNGFQFATSLLDGGAFDVAGRFAREYPLFRIVGGLGLGFATSRSHAQPGAYGYAGVPAGAGGISLGGTNSAPGSPSVADVSANGSTQFDGSVSVLFKSGLNLTVAGGVRDPHYTDPTRRPLSPDLLFGKLGYQLHLFPIGLTAFSIDYAENDDLIFAGDHARAWGAAVVQNIDRFGTELYLAGRYETLVRPFASYHPIVAIMSGARVRF